MAMESSNDYEAVKAAKGRYTYRVICSFELQFSFSEAEVEQDPMGGEGTDFNPTDDALRALEAEMLETLREKFSVSKIEAYAESDELLGFLPE